MRSTTLMAVLVLALAVLLAGCGGGSGEGGSEGGSGDQQVQGDGERTGGEEAGGEGAGGGTKIALGRIASVNAGAGRFAVEPSTEEQGEEPISFKFAEGGRITLDGQPVELSAMQEGQQAQIEYVVLKDLNRARVVELFGGEATAE